MSKRVLVTLDGSSTSEAVLPEVEKLGRDVQVILLSVARPPHGEIRDAHPVQVAAAPAGAALQTAPMGRTLESRTQAFDHVRDQTQAYLESRARSLREHGQEVQPEVAFGDPADEIVEFARAKDVDLIAMATHGRSALVRVICGSVAAEVMRSGVKPVLLVRPGNLAAD